MSRLGSFLVSSRSTGGGQRCAAFGSRRAQTGSSGRLVAGALILGACISLSTVGCAGSPPPQTYGVTPWSGPEVAFGGTWTASAILDGTGAPVSGSDATIIIIASKQQGSALRLFAFQLDYSTSDPCLSAFNFRSSLPMVITADGHGFDGEIGTNEGLSLHARVDANMRMHVELDAQSHLFPSPNGTIGGTCTESFSFVATRDPDGGT